MKAIDVLSRDHQRIEKVLDLLEDTQHQLDAGGMIDVGALRDVVGLCEQWIDRAHVLKEEEALFPLLNARGLGPETTVIAALMSQHQTGQAFLRELQAAVRRLAGGDRAAARDVSIWIRDYVQLVREHMRIEDKYFYELAADSLGPGDDARLLEKFDRIDRTIGASARERARWLALLAAGNGGPPH